MEYMVDMILDKLMDMVDMMDIVDMADMVDMMTWCWARCTLFTLFPIPRHWTLLCMIGIVFRHQLR